MMKIDTKIHEIFRILDPLADSIITFLNYKNCFELLIGVILSAQTTDMQVNRITPELFKRFPGAGELSEASQPEVAAIIRPIGFFNTKSANIIKTADMLHKTFSDTVPESMDSLLKLPGVGRKTANVIRGAWFGLPAVIVDTHFSRTASRLGLTKNTAPDKIEEDLAAAVPGDIQYRFSMLLNKLGRDYCKAKRPLCSECPLRQLCEWKH